VDDLGLLQWPGRPDLIHYWKAEISCACCLTPSLMQTDGGRQRPIWTRCDHIIELDQSLLPTVLFRVTLTLSLKKRQWQAADALVSCNSLVKRSLFVLKLEDLIFPASHSLAQRQAVASNGWAGNIGKTLLSSLLVLKLEYLIFSASHSLFLKNTGSGRQRLHWLCCDDYVELIWCFEAQVPHFSHVSLCLV
jgi:hypothetical protein